MFLNQEKNKFVIFKKSNDCFNNIVLIRLIICMTPNKNLTILGLCLKLNHLNETNQRKLNKYEIVITFKNLVINKCGLTIL